jgi:hypothetical protein
MTIYRAQMAAIDAITRRPFVDSVEANVHEMFPPQCAAMGNRETRRLVESGIASGMDCGFSQGRDLIQFVHLIFMYGEGFEKRPQVASVMRPGSALAPEDRLKRTFSLLQGTQRGGATHRPH